MNERITGVIRPRNTAHSSRRSNHRSARSSFSGAQVQPPAVSLEPRAAQVVAERPAADRADQVADRPGDRDREVRGQPALELVPEERDRLGRERARGDGAAVDHHDLACRREDGVDQHQEEHRVEAVVADRVGDPRRDVTERARRRASRDASRVAGCHPRGAEALRMVIADESTDLPRLDVADDLHREASLDRVAVRPEPVPRDLLPPGVARRGDRESAANDATRLVENGDRDARGAGEREGDRDLAPLRRHGAELRDLEEAERVVDDEGPCHRRALPDVVDRLHVEGPGTGGRGRVDAGRARLGRAGKRHRVGARRLLGRRRDRRRSVRRTQRDGHRRRAIETVAEVRRVVDAVAVRRDPRRGRSGRRRPRTGRRGPSRSGARAPSEGRLRSAPSNATSSSPRCRSAIA